MPNGNSIYDVYFGAGEAAGEYESSLRDIEDVWGDIAHKREKFAWETETRETNIDTLMSAVELGGELYGGYEAKEKFKISKTGVQKLAAKKAYEKSIKGVEGATLWGDLDDITRQEFIEKFTPTKIGEGGELWSDVGGFKKMFQKPQWKFGEGKESYTLGKEDVSILSQAAKYGYKPDMDIFRTSLLEEATGVKSPVKTIPEEEIVTTTEPPTAEPPTAKTPIKPPVADMPPLDKETYQMLSDMVDKFKKGNQKPMLAEDLATLQPWIDQMARSRGWTGAAWQ
tara:strand:- start:229 stop:1077 length:849 start_codon:yes stop_codon:yes gene_type:complete